MVKFVPIACSEQLVLEVLKGVGPARSAPVCIACLAWGMPATEVVPAAAAQVSDTDVQPALFQKECQQAGHEDAPVPAAVGEEADDQVDAGMTLSHGPGEECTQCLAQVLDDCRTAFT